MQPGFVETEMTKNNRHPMPLKWTAERAATYIARRLESAPAVIAFPWPLAFLTRLSRHLPNWIYDRTTRLLSG